MTRRDPPSEPPQVSILDAIDSPEVWAGWFKRPETWQPWRAFLSVLFGLPLDAAGLELFRECTGRVDPPATGFTEAWLVIGRRGGKSFVLALIACYLAIFRDWRPYVVPGETPVIKIIAVDRRQSRIIHRYCRALLTQVPAFSSLVSREGDDTVELSNGVAIEVATASFRSTRGYSAIAALIDEIAFLRTDEMSANPDAEILRAVRGTMATVPGAFLLCASSPYAKRGELWNAYRRHHGHDDSPALTWRAPTRTMNPTVAQSFVDEQLERDPSGSAAEFLAEFRSDVNTFINPEVVADAVVPGRRELPRLGNTHYFAWTDTSGSGADSFTLGIAHLDRERRAVLDVVRERRPPFSPEQVAAEFAGTLRAYHVKKVVGDAYGGEWPREQFRKAGVTYEVSDRPKSAIYLEILPALNSGRVELLDHPRLISQICGLERRTARSGRDSVDHAPGSHDDVANSALGALLLASKATSSMALRPDQLMRAAALPRRDRFGRSGGMPNFSPRQMGLR
jgi:hypothetical protein